MVILISLLEAAGMLWVQQQVNEGVCANAIGEGKHSKSCAQRIVFWGSYSWPKHPKDPLGQRKANAIPVGYLRETHVT